MTWSDFLRYSKYIAVFYVIAFMIGILGIWMEPHGQWIWTASMFFGAALAGNVALGIYHANHKGSMLMAKNDYLQEQGAAQVITGERNKSLELRQSGLTADMEDFMREQVEKQIRHTRGY